MTDRFGQLLWPASKPEWTTVAVVGFLWACSLIIATVAGARTFGTTHLTVDHINVTRDSCPAIVGAR